MSVPRDQPSKSRHLAVPTRSLPPSRVGYVHPLPWGFPVHRGRNENTPLPRITINERGYPQVEPLDTLDLPRPPDDDIRREALRGCFVASALLFLFGSVVVTALLVYGIQDIFGSVADPTTISDDGKHDVIYYKRETLLVRTTRKNNGTNDGSGNEPTTVIPLDYDDVNTTTNRADIRQTNSSLSR